MDTAQLVATIMSSLGVGGLLTQFVRFLIKRANGTASRQREANTSIVMQRVKAIEERDLADARANEADRKRRLATDEVARLRYKLIQNGIEPGPEIDLERTARHPRARRPRQSDAAE